MFISTLDVVNGCLSTIGEAGLTDLQEDHAYRDLALTFLKEETDRVAARGWWFNQELTYLQPDSNSGFIYVPTDVYSVVTPARGFAVTQMGRRMYNSRNRTYVWDRALPVRLTRSFPFDDLPFQAQVCIKSYTLLKFQGRIDADRETKGDVMREAAQAWEELIRIDAQNQKHNMLSRPGMEHNAWLAVTPSAPNCDIVGPNIIWAR